MRKILLILLVACSGYCSAQMITLKDFDKYRNNHWKRTFFTHGEIRQQIVEVGKDKYLLTTFGFDKEGFPFRSDDIGPFSMKESIEYLKRDYLKAKSYIH